MWQDLIETLDKLGEVYDKLAALGEKKRNALVVINMKGLSDILDSNILLLQQVKIVLMLQLFLLLF